MRVHHVDIIDLFQSTYSYDMIQFEGINPVEIGYLVLFNVFGLCYDLNSPWFNHGK